MNSRPPPPRQGPPPYAFVSRAYRRNLRPIVLSVAFLAGLWSLFDAIGYFRNSNIDGGKSVALLHTVSIALGALYMSVTAIEVFGIYAAGSQKLPFVRIYAFLCVLVILIVFGASMTSTVIHFIAKTDLINNCSTEENGQPAVTFYGFWGPVSRTNLTPQEARDFCQNLWDRDTWSEIISLLATTFLAALFSAIAFGYYRQVLDPTSPANASRAPSSQVRMDAFPSHYNPPYNASVPNLGYNDYSSQPRYAPPAGAPPGHEHDDSFVPPYDGKPPGYAYDGKHDYGMDDNKDPFGDSGDRDATSLPGPGGRDPFR